MNFAELPDPALIVEGPSDTAAGLTMGLSAVGRPMARGGADILAQMLRDRADVIVVGERDEKPDGTWPGRDGAKHVAQALAQAWRRPVAWALPPGDAKDIRAYLCQGNGNGTDPAELGRRLVEHLQANPNWIAPGEDDEDDTEERQKPRKQADLLIELAAAAELFHAGDDAFASVTVDDHRETWALNAKAFRRWLTREYHRRFAGAPNAQSLQDALGVLSSRALFDGPELTTAIRLAQADGAIYVDLCDPDWRVVRVDRDGWRIIPAADCPVRFIRRRGMLALPAPVTGGSVDNLRPFVNLPDDDGWVLFVAWMVAALRPQGPYPVLPVTGPQGSGKTYTCRVARSLVDPNAVPLRRPPRDERDCMIAATNSWVVAFDNVSGLAPWLSDGLCTPASGGGLATRELYSDREETLLSATRPIMLNGIDEPASRPDLLDRSILLTLPVIADRDRRDQETMNAAFEAARPGILGALLTAVSTGLRNIGSVRLTSHPRMADFARWMVASEPALPWPAGTFMDAYVGNRSAANDLALEASVIAGPVLDLIRDRGSWSGTAGGLLAALGDLVDEKDRQRREWPRSAKAVSDRLRRVSTNLAAVGVAVTFDREPRRGRRRIIHIEKVCDSASTSSIRPQTAVALSKTPVVVDGVDARVDGVDAGGSAVRPPEKRPGAIENAVVDGVDGVDAEIPTHSGDDDVDDSDARERAAIQSTEAEEEVLTQWNDL